MVLIIEPQDGMAVYDPTRGLGRHADPVQGQVEEAGGDARNLALFGQELNGGTWAICKMNMILHGIPSADIRQGDTLRDPQHLAANGELRRFDRVIANPPFSQNYSRADMKFKDRFHSTSARLWSTRISLCPARKAARRVAASGVERIRYSLMYGYPLSK